ncbi:hypothetical protein ACFU53_11745 [Streptomyces sp. NPDC057474]|uniref:hypothetical protein n=1 Tax=Streptomyces sp. NPDC057474 TaxID=3346144 RepID=UPI0036BE409C
MTATPSSSDPTMEAVAQAVTEGRAGDVASARRQLLGLWSEIGVTGDPLHRCALAHYMADLYTDPAQALAWDVRALDAADAVTQQRVQEHDARLRIAGFYPSLHLNLADNYRRLASFEAATEHIEAAEEHAPSLARDAYGDFLRAAIEQVAEAIGRQDTAARTSAPGTTA